MLSEKYGSGRLSVDEIRRIIRSASESIDGIILLGSDIRELLFKVAVLLVWILFISGTVFTVFWLAKVIAQALINGRS